MNDNKPTRATLFVTVVAGLLLVSVIALRSIRPVSSVVNDPTLNTLNQQASELVDYNAVRLSKAREEQAQAQARLGTPEKLEAWRSSIPSSWRVQEVAPIPATFTVQRRFMLNRPAAAFRDWPDIVAFLTALDEKPGLRIQTLYLTASAGSTRNFTQVQALVSLASPKNETTPAVAP